MSKIYETKNLINSLVKVMHTVGEIAGFDDPSDAANGVKVEIAMFLMYLSASDGEIKWEEASTISELCDLNLTPQSLSDFIRENNIYSTEFENKVPISLKLLVTVDNQIVENNMENEVDAGYDTLINAYYEIAKVFMASDDDVDINEKNDCNIYLDMMRNYVKQNSIRGKKSVSGFVKNTGGVSAPTKSGVSAPKKG